MTAGMPTPSYAAPHTARPATAGHRGPDPGDPVEVADGVLRQPPAPPLDVAVVLTRNARLAAIHSLFGYAALRHPEHEAVIQRVLAIPTARIKRNLVTYFDHAEADAFLAACKPATRPADAITPCSSWRWATATSRSCSVVDQRQALSCGSLSKWCVVVSAMSSASPRSLNCRPA